MRLGIGFTDLAHAGELKCITAEILAE